MSIANITTAPATNASRNPNQQTNHAAGGQRVVINGRLGIGKTIQLASCFTPALLLPTSGKQAKRGNS